MDKPQNNDSIQGMIEALTAYQVLTSFQYFIKKKLLPNRNRKKEIQPPDGKKIEQHFNSKLIDIALQVSNYPTI